MVEVVEGCRGRMVGGLGTGIEVLAYGDGLKIFLNLQNNIISIYFTMKTYIVCITKIIPV